MVGPTTRKRRQWRNLLISDARAAKTALARFKAGTLPFCVKVRRHLPLYWVDGREGYFKSMDDYFGLGICMSQTLEAFDVEAKTHRRLVALTVAEASDIVIQAELEQTGNIEDALDIPF